LELSSIEIGLIVKNLNGTIPDYFVSNVYSINADSILFKLHHSEKTDQWLIISARRGLWLTKQTFEQKTASGLVSTLRKELNRAKIISLEQPKAERIVIIIFKRNDDHLKLISEFFGEGNIVLTDRNDRIISSLIRLRVRHREVLRGKQYILPPTKGIDPRLVSFENLLPLTDSNLEISRWLGRNLSLSKKYVEEILARAEIPFHKMANILNEDDVRKIYSKINEVVSLVNSDQVEPNLVYEQGQPVDASPFKLITQSHKEIEVSRSYLEILDKVLSEEIFETNKRFGMHPYQQKIAEISHTIDEQNRTREKHTEKAKFLRSLALKISQTEFSGTIYDNVNRFSKLGLSNITSKNDTLHILIEGTSIVVKKNSSVMFLVSKLYDEAKSLEKKIKAIEKAAKSLESGKNELIRKIEKQEIDMKAKIETRREKSWYERYRWFITTDELQAIGGRDASSNSAIIRKHMSERDLIFHADIHGSPFFILKEGNTKRETDIQKSIQEIAQAVVSFSKGWKEGLTSLDAYWVYANQVKKQAPSGMYLPKGSFLIEGKKNYLKGLRLILALGVQKRKDGIVVFSGPPESVKKHSLYYVLLESYNEKVSDTAKKVKSVLVAKAKEEEKHLFKVLSLDDIMRTLPGGGRIKTCEFGEQVY
jgi:predicted ribosome quality control (RQC) complex YloA/Tae2 family protein